MMYHRKGRKHDNGDWLPMVLFPFVLLVGVVLIWVIAFIGSHLDKLLQ